MRGYLGEAGATLETDTTCEAEVGREPTRCRSVPERVPRPAGCISWISPPSRIVHSTHHMLREGLCLSIPIPATTASSPSLGTSPSSPGGLDGVCPGEHRAASSPLLWAAGFVEQISFVEHSAAVVSLSGQAPPKAGHRARGSACLLNKPPSCLSNALSTFIIGSTFPCLYLQYKVGYSSGVFLTEYFLRLDRHTGLSLPLSGGVFCSFTCRKHRYNTFLCQQGNLHSHPGRSTRVGRNLSLNVNNSALGIWPSPVTTSLTG